MSTRRTDLLDAAITLLGEQGVRALTHRAVDAQAGLPAGSTVNHFSTRDALIAGVASRIAERERALWEEIAARMCPTTPAELASAMVTLAREATGPNRALTLARYSILGEAAHQPQLRDHFLAVGGRVDAYFTNWIRVIGSPAPERDAPLVMNHWTGLVLHQLAIPDPEFTATGQITDLIHTLETSWKSGARSTRIG
jgi:DNA-binding transcriptional regulator YbjK